MHLHPLGPPPTTLDEAAAQQEKLSSLVDATGSGPSDPRTVAGIDVAHREGTDDVVAAVVVLDATTLRPVETRTARGRACHPYEPGFLALRELPAVTAALEALETAPELIVCDGAGVAHPRRFGLACHVGLLTGLPTIGVAKTPPVPFEMPKPARGCWTPQVDGDEVVGRALRTQHGVRPVFVSVGHRIALDAACDHVLRLSRHRLPETTRRADRLARDAVLQV
ncbi:endonuclease V [Pseudonocardia sp. DSM 110487]|uniref:endonuclease V n=1 Tax=Pseudonocardia sp. DSM 110487 TaxID=2865833 RepID=UPI001C6A4868|nr:endonuclease V [Pseudonocardia sp. DSM 110487]QYN34282.1 endonuclease V [Pseudonocardia sp. DSM 110487]